MLSRFHGIFILCIATVAGTSCPSVGRCGRVGCALNIVGVLLALPQITHQWSFLGLHLWPKREVDQAASNQLQEPLDATQFSARVLNFFPVPVEEECLSEDKRRQGTCMNTYECRIQNGVSHGPCALGFGVCCIFTASCDNEVQNNLTYVTSPGFPNLIDRPMNCSVVVRKIDTEVSQLRIDFVHFNIGQPNAMTGVCDEDVMVINNGRTSFELCGWNSGQHVYVDVGEGNEPITINFRLPSGLQSRMWEMRVLQLGFEQRAPVGCLQYFRAVNGTLRTFNYLANGRYLAGHDYLLCVRQERDMCGIAYQPCTRDSFRIGPGRAPETGLNGTGSAPVAPANPSIASGPADPGNADVLAEGSGAGPPVQQQEVMLLSATRPSPTLASFVGRCADRILIPCDFEEFITVGDGLIPIPAPRRDCHSTFANLFFQPGNNVAGICNLEHCGNSLCNRDQLDAEGSCRVEVWSTPFRIRVAFGPGNGTSGTLEDNAGMCLVYQQLPCVA